MDADRSLALRDEGSDRVAQKEGRRFWTREPGEFAYWNMWEVGAMHGVRHATRRGPTESMYRETIGSSPIVAPILGPEINVLAHP